jgi:nucleoside-diphosphate-sugar epimerase
MQNILIIGGTQNLGYLTANALLQKGHQVTILNRGLTPDELPASVERLRADRSNVEQLKSQLHGRSFDAVVDTTLYNGKDASTIIDLLDGICGHYIFVSTGQVYLVRTGPTRPFREEDYSGPVMDHPADGTDLKDWLYGVEKRQAEDVLAEAWAKHKFPFTSLRLPMVNSERDHFNRIYGYLLRISDGGPLLVPAGPHLSLRHIYGMDVVKAISLLTENRIGLGRAFNISQDESVAIDDFISMLATLSNRPSRIVRVERSLLESKRLLPGCSHFSDSWMSELDNTRSKIELKTQYTPLPVYLEKLVSHYRQHAPPIPTDYQRRSEELEIASKAI